MDDFDISNIEDMKELATILNHDQTELDLMHEPKNAEKAQTLQGYEDLLEELHKKAKKDDWAKKSMAKKELKFIPQEG